MRRSGGWLIGELRLGVAGGVWHLESRHDVDFGRLDCRDSRCLTPPPLSIGSRMSLATLRPTSERAAHPAGVGFRYAMSKSVYAELTQKFAYGKLHGVPVHHGGASQEIRMSEQVLSVGLLF